MPRAKLRREPCDCLDCREPPPASSAAAGGSAAIARQDPAPKSLVLCLTGALQSEDSLREAELPHLDAAVRAGWAGLLACRADGPALPLQLLGLRRTGEAPAQSLADRFKQLRAVLLTDSHEVAHAGELAGCYAVHQIGSGSYKGSGGGGDSLCSAWQPPEQLAAHICRLLHVRPLPSPGSAAVPEAATHTAAALAAVFAAAGLGGSSEAAGGGGKDEDDEEGDDVIDMLLLVLDATKAHSGSGGSSGGAGSDEGGSSGGAGSDEGGSSGAAALDWADRLVRCLNQAPGFRQTVLLSLVVGPGQHPVAGAPALAQDQPLLQPGTAPTAPAAGQPAAQAAQAADCPPVRRPLQSYQYAGLERVAVDTGRPALVVHRLPAVIRVDQASRLGLAHIAAQGGAGCILAERLLPEVAYKLGRAPKYGA